MAAIEFGAPQLRDWAESLGVSTFVGSSGRVFPTRHEGRAAAACLAAPAAPAASRVTRCSSTCATAGSDGTDGIGGRADACGSTARDGPVQAQRRCRGAGARRRQLAAAGVRRRWVAPLAARGVDLAPLLPANCGFDVAGGWSPHFAQRFAGSRSSRSRCGSLLPTVGRGLRAQGRVCRHRHRYRGQPGVCRRRACLRDAIAGTGQADAAGRSAAGAVDRAGGRQVAHPAGLAILVQPPQEPAGSRWHQGRVAA